MPAETHKPQFDPPPWEREAFERFQQEQAKSRSTEELEAELQRVRNDEPLAEQPTPAPQPTTSATEQTQAEPAVSDAKIDSMLIQLRVEEPPAKLVNKPLVNGVIAFLSLIGTTILIQSALLFGDVGNAEPAGKMLAATMSLMVLFTGLGFLAGAFMLFRKYHS